MSDTTAAFARLHTALVEASALVTQIAESLNGTKSGLLMAAETVVLADLRAADHDAIVLEKYAGEL
jgi:hypothetical protein